MFAILACMTDIRPRNWEVSVVERAVIAGPKSEVVVGPRSAEEGRTDILMISRARDAPY